MQTDKLNELATLLMVVATAYLVIRIGLEMLL